MYLKKLELQGFKSFPEKTVIEFHEGVTAIVGPNGSGKSNITDAIRWVLGEQSVKTLRGSKMEDVIFTGTQSRRAMGFAEVTMVIDNTDGRLPVEYSEISVSRRLYRSGDSEYLINKTVCRLKDVQTMFMDTGIGRDGYSIVSQGKVDEILSHKSEDRRKVFEEASGIVKFKTRKDEAERKLENTAQNLLRINDIIAELQSQIGPLEQQAKVARQYLVHRDELKSVEIALFLDNITKYSQKYDEYSEEYDSILKHINIKTIELDDLKHNNRELTAKSEEIEAEIEKIRAELQTVTDKIKENTATIGFNESKSESIRSRLDESNLEGGSLEESLKQLEDEMSSRKDKEKYLLDQLVIYSRKLEGYETEMQGILSDLGESEAKAERIKLRIDELTENLYDKRMQARQTRGQIKMIEQREKSVESDIALLISEQDALNIQKEECEDLLNNIINEKQKVSEEVDSLKIRLDKSRSQANEIMSQSDAAKSRTENLEYRVRMLKELEKAREGYSDAVKSIMDLKNNNTYNNESILGTVGDLIGTDEKYTTAIEIALGSSIQNIVTDTEKTASALIDYLKTNRLGRATFLPVSSIRGRGNDKSAASSRNAPGFIGNADELVRYPDAIREIVSGLLGRIVIMDDLNNAISLARKTGYSFRIVTLEGDVVNPGGALTGGFQKGRGTGVLGRARDIERLTAESADARKEAAKLIARIPEIESEMTGVAGELMESEKLLTIKEHERIREDSRLAQIVRDISRCAGRIGMLRAEQEQITLQKTDIDSEADALEAEAVSSEEETEKLKAELDLIRISSKEEEENRDELREMISDLKISVNSIEESLASVKEINERILKEKEQYEAASRKREEEIIKANRELEELAGQNNEAVRRIGELNAVKSELEAEQDKLISSRREIDDQLSGFYDKFQIAAQETSDLQTELARSEGKKVRVETALDDAKNKLWEQYELTTESAAKWSIQIESATMAQRKVNELRKLIKELGNININAIEEYEKVAERYEFLVGQRDDIEETRNKLLKIISEITSEMKKQFITHFRVINENFKEVFAELFGGGMAEIVLGDEQDVLNCNIDIIAQPPGKKLQNMLLLSGGERCLTAIALLFAILKLRPSPFCVLDEIEAALDDANIIRFGEYIRNYTSRSQFILVTHRKGTMEAADMIYGVTMQERGISRILSMKLTD